MGARIHTYIHGSGEVSVTFSSSDPACSSPQWPQPCWPKLHLVDYMWWWWVGQSGLEEKRGETSFSPTSHVLQAPIFSPHLSHFCYAALLSSMSPWMQELLPHLDYGCCFLWCCKCCYFSWFCSCIHCQLICKNGNRNDQFWLLFMVIWLPLVDKKKRTEENVDDFRLKGSWTVIIINLWFLCFHMKQQDGEDRWEGKVPVVLAALQTDKCTHLNHAVCLCC